MIEFHWLRLGGLIACKWPTIDFAEVAIRLTKEYYVHTPVMSNPCEEIIYENEDIKLEKAIIEGHIVGVGYGPKSKKLFVNIG